MAGEMIQYQTEDGVTVVRLQARDGNVWLSQADIAELFQVTPRRLPSISAPSTRTASSTKRQLVTITYKFEPRANERFRAPSRTTTFP